HAYRENTAAANIYAREFVSFFECGSNQAKLAYCKLGKVCPAIDFGLRKPLTTKDTKVHEGFLDQRIFLRDTSSLRGSSCFSDGERYFSHWLDSRWDAGHLAAGAPIGNNWGSTGKLNLLGTEDFG